MSDEVLWGISRELDINRQKISSLSRDIPAIYLPTSQRVLNPFPLASSGGGWGDIGLPWAVRVLAFYATVYVITTNSGVNFWTIALIAQPSGATVASFTTAAIAPDVLNRLSDLTITQPASTDNQLLIRPTATLSPGALLLFPSVALLRTG